MIGRRVALAVGVLALGAVPAVRVGTSSSPSAAPPSAATNFVKPIVECVVKTGSSYTAWFGYDNSRSTVVLLPTPSLNHFSPGPKDRGQPTTFQPGRHSFVVSVPFSGNITWVLGTQPAVAKTSSTKCSAPTITTTSLPAGTAGLLSNVVVQATGGVPPRVFSAIGLPPGLSIASDGTISGVPTAVGTFTVKVTVTDKIGQKATKEFPLKIEGVQLECGESTSAGGDGTPGATLTLLDEGECQTVTVVLRTGEDEVELIKEDSPNSFTMVIEWDAEMAKNPLDPTKIDFCAGEVNVVWCLSGPVAPPDTPWCLVEQRVRLVGGNQVQLTETYFGQNDPSWTRR
jgi:hypothetical protein